MGLASVVSASVISTAMVSGMFMLVMAALYVWIEDKLSRKQR